MRTLPTASFSTAAWAAAVLLEREPVQRQAGVLADRQRAVVSAAVMSSAAACSASGPTV